MLLLLHALFRGRKSTETNCPLASIHLFGLTRSMEACERAPPLHADPNVMGPRLATKPEDTVIF